MNWQKKDPLTFYQLIEDISEIDDIYETLYGCESALYNEVFFAVDNISSNLTKLKEMCLPENFERKSTGHYCADLSSDLFGLKAMYSVEPQAMLPLIVEEVVSDLVPKIQKLPDKKLLLVARSEKLFDESKKIEDRYKQIPAQSNLPTEKRGPVVSEDGT